MACDREAAEIRVRLFKLGKSARSVLRAIQRSPQRVRAYFKPEPVRYAA